MNPTAQSQADDPAAAVRPVVEAEEEVYSYACVRLEGGGKDAHV